MSKRLFGNLGLSTGFDIISDEEMEELIRKGPDEIEEEERADKIDVVSQIRLKQDKQKRDDYEDDIDAYNDAVDRLYYEEL